jgi:hypothetical protein
MEISSFRKAGRALYEHRPVTRRMKMVGFTARQGVAFRRAE